MDGVFVSVGGGGGARSRPRVLVHTLAVTASRKGLPCFIPDHFTTGPRARFV